MEILYSSSKKWDVVGLGVSTIDILTVVDDFPSGEDVVKAHDSAVQGGGPVATAIFTLGILGAKVRMIDRLGDDWRGRLILKEYEEAGVSTDLISIDPSTGSSLATILVRKRDGKRSIIYAPGSEKELEMEDVPFDAISSAKILHVNGRHWRACLAACEHARKNGTYVSFDGGAYRYRPEIRLLVAMSDICIVALDFARRYSKTDDVDKAAGSFLNAGPSIVAITDGLNGSWIFSSEKESFHQPAFRLPKVIDTTGCGDAYHGAFLFGLLQGLRLRNTAEVASMVAAMNSQKLGGRAGLPTLEALRVFARNHELTIC
jgi:sulfofructose kinase